jgi:hypothetical protein
VPALGAIHVLSTNEVLQPGLRVHEFPFLKVYLQRLVR